MGTDSTPPGMPADAEALRSALAAERYVADHELATVLWLALRLERPVLLEGPAGVGKTALATAMAAVTGRPLIRLQCYEGLDESKALYEWEYSRQLLYTQILRDKIGEQLAGAATLSEAVDRIAAQDAAFFDERFLIARPLLQALRAPAGAVLLIDEVDKADPEFEAFLLEVLGEHQVTVPELGTFRATVAPVVLLTSNRTRDLGEALRRRCLHVWLDFPAPERELEIIRGHLPELPEQLGSQIVDFVERVRGLDLAKPPAVAETLDWARSLLVLHARSLDAALVRDTAGVLLKLRDDRSQVLAQLSAAGGGSLLPG